MTWDKVSCSRGYFVLAQLIITVGTLFTVAGLPSPQAGSGSYSSQPLAGGLPQQQQGPQSTPLPPGIIGVVPGIMGSTGSGTASFPANAANNNNQGGQQMPPPGSQFTVGVGGVRRNYAGWREWRRADPTLINTLWRNKMGNGIRKQLGNAEVYIMLALLIGLATVVIGCWLSDNCWSPEPEHVVTLA